MCCSGFGHISYFFFHFYKTKKLNSFCKFFSKPKISDFFGISVFSELETLKSVSEASEAAGINSEVCQQFRLLRNFRFFFLLKFQIFFKISDFFFRCPLRAR